jgi:hypothetical protein
MGGPEEGKGSVTPDPKGVGIGDLRKVVTPDPKGVGIRGMGGPEEGSDA